MKWKYNDITINTIEDFPKGTYGFVYEVTHIPTNKKYIGKKVLFFERTVKIGKKELEQIKEERKIKKIKGKSPSKKKIIKESDWKIYCGSHKEIKRLVERDGIESFTRLILKLAPNKKLLTYYEYKYLYSRGVLEPDSNYINDNIGGTIYSVDFSQLTQLE